MKPTPLLFALAMLLGTLCQALLGCAAPPAIEAPSFEEFKFGECGTADVQTIDAETAEHGDCTTVWLESAPRGRWLRVVGDSCSAPRAQCVELYPGQAAVQVTDGVGLLAEAPQAYAQAGRCGRCPP